MLLDGEDAVAFLRAFPPFGDVRAEELRGLVSAAEVHGFGPGEFLLRAGEPNPGRVLVVRRGHVELVVDGAVVDVLGPGEIVGLPSGVSGLPAALDARTAEDVVAYAFAPAAVLPLLSGRDGLRFLARTVSERASLRGAVPALADAPLPLLPLARSVVCAGAAQPLHDVAEAMRRHDATCAVVRGAGGPGGVVLGIVTDRDLRERVLARAMPASVPIGEIASSPVVTIGPESSTDDAAHLLLAHGVRHLPVVADDGRVLGVVEDVDLLAAESRTPVRLRRDVARAPDLATLVHLAQGIRPAVVAALRGGRRADTVGATYGTLVDAVVVKALELHVAHDRPPAEFAWVVTGSVARGEAVPSSDVDTLLAWRGDDDPATRRRMRSFAAAVLATLGACGLAHDVNGFRADDPRCSRPVEGWRSAIGGWARDPFSDQHDLYLSAVTDARPVWGHAVWGPVAEAVRASHARGAVRTMMHRAALHVRPPTGFVRGLVIESSGDHAGTVDLKRGGAAPVVMAGRYLSTLVPASAPGTTARLRRAQSHGLLARDDAQDLVEALLVVQQTRWHRQAAQWEVDMPPDDHQPPAELTTLERRGLRDAFRVVARAQRNLPPPVALP